MHARKSTGRAPRIINGQTEDGRLAVNPREAAALLGIGEGLAYAKINNGSLPSIKLGSRRVVAVAAIEKLLAGETEK